MPSSTTRRTALARLAALGTGLTLSDRARAQGPALVLGQSAPTTGAAAQLGLQMNLGARLHFEAVNAAGGIFDRPIELRLLDDGYEPARTQANTEAFLQANALALFGYVGTPTALAVLPRVKEAQVPFFGPFTGAQALREPLARTVFHVRASYFDETALIVRSLTQLGLKKIAVFRQNDSYGQAGLDGVQRALAAKGLAPVAVGGVERNSTDVSGALNQILAQQPDAVVLVSAYKSCAAFIRSARRLGYGGSFYNLSFVGTQALADELGKDARGVMVSQVMPYPFNATSGIGREYLDAVKARGGQHAPNYSSMEGYVAARVLTEGLRRAGKNPSREALVAALEGMPKLDLGGFTVNFSPRDHVGSSFVDLTMLTEDGRVRR